MSTILIVSILIRLAAFGWSLLLLRRSRDWRLAFFSGMLALMALRQTLALMSGPAWQEAPDVARLSELPALLVSALALLAVLFLHRVLTEQRQAARRADDAHARLIEAIESMSEGFGLYDAEDRLILCNTKYRELYDVSADLLVPGVRFEDHVRASAYRGQWTDANGCEEVWTEERVKQHRDPEGTYEQQLASGRWLRVVERKTRDGGIVGVRADITAEKTAEEALRRSKARVRSLFENTPVSIWELDFSQGKAFLSERAPTDPDDLEAYLEEHQEIVQEYVRRMKLIDVNQASLQLFGASEKEQLFGDVSRFFTAKTYGAITEILVAMHHGQTHSELETEVLTLDGSRRDVSLRSSVPPGYEESLSRVLVSVVDVTERKQVERELGEYRERLEDLVAERTGTLEARTVELAQANIRLQEANRHKSVFLASMSHELRTPLNSIIGFTGIILQGMTGEITPEQRKQLTMVRHSAHHLLSLINEVLDVSKIEAGQLELFLEECRLDDVVGEVTATLSPAVGEKGLELRTKLPRGITLVSDRKRLRQILLNLLSNAVKFTEQGVVEVTGGVSADGGLEIRVADTGIGIREEDMDTLFMPFQQMGKLLARPHEGTGLGLYLSKHLASLLGGDIRVRSEYGVGSEFTIVLPLAFEEERTG